MKKSTATLVALAFTVCACWITGVVTSAMMNDAVKDAFEAGRSASFGKLRLADADTVYELKLVGIIRDGKGDEIAYDLDRSWATPMNDSYGQGAVKLLAGMKAGDKVFFDSQKGFVIVPR